MKGTLLTDYQIKELSKSKDEAADLGPRIFTLNKYVQHSPALLETRWLIFRRNVYQMRIDKIRNAEIAKRNRERLNNPANFPAPPSGFP